MHFVVCAHSCQTDNVHLVQENDFEHFLTNHQTLKGKSGEFSQRSPFLEVTEYCRYKTKQKQLFRINSTR